MGKAGYEPGRHRIGHSTEDDRNGPGRLLRGDGGGCGLGHDDIHLEAHQFGRKRGEPVELAIGSSVIDHDVAALDVPEVTESLKKGCRETADPVGSQPANSRELGGLLGLDGDRGDDPTEEEGYAEGPPP